MQAGLNLLHDLNIENRLKVQNPPPPPPSSQQASKLSNTPIKYFSLTATTPFTVSSELCQNDIFEWEKSISRVRQFFYF